MRAAVCCVTGGPVRYGARYVPLYQQPSVTPAKHDAYCTCDVPFITPRHSTIDTSPLGECE